MRIKVERPERLRNHRLMAKHVVRPQPALLLLRYLLAEYLAQQRKLRMQTWIAADHRNHTGIIVQTPQRRAEVLQRHVPFAPLIGQEPRAIAALQIAAVGNIKGDDVMLTRRAHLRYELVRRPVSHTQP